MRERGEYVTFIVRDLKKSISFYRDVLGYRIGLYTDAGEMGKIQIMHGNYVDIELIECDMFPVGMYSFGIVVDDLRKELDLCKHLGLKCTSPIGTRYGHVAFVEDPDGNNICFKEFHK